jgi:amphi-Trp domain-containing protein
VKKENEMGKDKKSLAVDFVGNPQEIAQKLEEFVKAFVSGTICINSSGEELVLKPQNTIHLELEASTKEDKEKVSFKMKWHTHVEMDDEAAPSFTVSDTPTVIESEETAEEEAEETAEEPVVEAAAEEPVEEATGEPAEQPCEKPSEEEPKGKKDHRKGHQN